MHQSCYLVLWALQAFRGGSGPTGELGQSWRSGETPEPCREELPVMGNLGQTIQFFSTTGRTCLGNLACYGHLVLSTETEAEQSCTPLEREEVMTHTHTGVVACGEAEASQQWALEF